MRKRTGSGGVLTKRCPVCYRDVLSVFRGEVTAVGEAEILSVSRTGDIVGKCACGRRVVWEREAARPR